jgi:hypothetical protein
MLPLQLLVTQSAPLAHAWPIGHGTHTVPPQSTPVSAPSAMPSLQLVGAQTFEEQRLLEQSVLVTQILPFSHLAHGPPQSMSDSAASLIPFEHEPGAAPPVPTPPVDGAPPVTGAPPVDGAPPVIGAPPVSGAPPVFGAPPVNGAPPVSGTPPPVFSAPPVDGTPPLPDDPPLPGQPGPPPLQSLGTQSPALHISPVAQSRSAKHRTQ